MKKNDLKSQVAAAIQACLDKKAEELSILEMEKGSGAFTDYFVLCSGTNPRQVHRPRFLRKGAQVLRSRAPLEDREAAGTIRIKGQATGDGGFENTEHAPRGKRGFPAKAGIGPGVKLASFSVVV
jgi:hypothetical protein